MFPRSKIGDGAGRPDLRGSPPAQDAARPCRRGFGARAPSGHAPDRAPLRAGRPLLFARDAERAHSVAAVALRGMHARSWERGLLAPGQLPALPVEAMGLRFPSPVGMAAGFDKAGELYNGLGALGFGFVEVGT